MSETGIPNVLSYNLAKVMLPERKYFLNPQQTNPVSTTIKKGEQLLFLPTALWETHLQDEKYTKSVYKIVLMGILRDGRRVNVVIDNIEPYFEVRIPDDADTNYINTLRIKLNKDELTKPDKTSIIKAKPFEGFQIEQSRFIRFYYKKLYNRTKAIEFVRKEAYTTTTDDLSNYFRVVCRDYCTTFSSWVNLNDYYSADIDCLKGTTLRVSIENFKKYEDDIAQEPDLIKDKSLSVTWDIETASKDGAFPIPENLDHRITTIGMTFQWVHDKEPFYKVCFCDYPANARPEYISVICGNETNIIKGFAECFEKMRPEFMLGFNDSDYDWNWIITRSSQTKGLLSKIANCFDSVKPYQSYTDDNVKKYNCRQSRIKIDATTYAEGTCLKMNGYIPIDVRTSFRKMMLYKTAASSSLKFFLESNKLSGKEDMPYQRLFAIYNEYRTLIESRYAHWDTSGNSIEVEFNSDTPLEVLENYKRLKKELADVNYYCVIDAQRCHDLMRVRSVIMDSREVSDFSYVSLYDAFYFADGMKVRNLTFAVGQKHPFNMRFSNIPKVKDSDEKYIGAFVYPPKKGLKISKLSIEERIRKAQITKDRIYQSHQEWHGTTTDEIKEMYDIIEEYGSNISIDKIKDIEKEKNIKITKKFRDFLTEETGRPIAGLDFSSLYPSLIRAYNFSPEYYVKNKTHAKALEDAGYKLNKVDYVFGGRRQVSWFIWHNNKINPKKEILVTIDNDTTDTTDTPNTITTSTTIPLNNIKQDNQTNTAGTLDNPLDNIKQDNQTNAASTTIPLNNTLDIKQESKKILVDDPEFQFGLFPYILDDLFNRRAKLKKSMKIYDHQKEEMEAKGDEYIRESQDEYDNIKFLKGYLNSKQNALKVFMNTFYGEAGNSMSPINIRDLAAGVTTYGQKNIKMGFTFVVQDVGCKVYYGDTDSLYLSVPEYNFILVDKLYFTSKISKLEYWTKLVEISFVAIKAINTDVNNMFLADNGTKFLSMAYEEFLFPSAFTAKKKYYGIAHENIANFSPKELFIRGLDVKKRGVSGLLRIIFNDILWKSVNHTNILSLIELVQDKIDEIYATKWDMQDFIQTDVYRPNKNNVKIQTFVSRMKAIGIDVKPNERFEYVLVKKYPFEYDIRGRKKALGVGDKIEYVQNAIKNNMEIDLDHYMQSSINGQLGRLVAYHEQFHVEPRDESSTELFAAEVKIYKNACKFVDEYCKKYYASYNTFGKTYQKIFKTVNKIIGEKITERDSIASQLLQADANFSDFEKWLVERAEKESIKDADGYGENFIEEELNDIADRTERSNKLKVLQKIYYGDGSKSINAVRQKAFEETMSNLRKDIRNNTKEFETLFKVYQKGVENLMNIIKKKLNMDENLYNPTIISMAKEYKLDDFNTNIDNDQLEEKAAEYTDTMFNDTHVNLLVNKLKNLYMNIYSAHIIINRTKSIVDYLKLLRDRVTRVLARPDNNIMRDMINASIEESIANSTMEF